jgi:hypothetical protein
MKLDRVRVNVGGRSKIGTVQKHVNIETNGISYLKAQDVVEK